MRKLVLSLIALGFTSFTLPVALLAGGSENNFKAKIQGKLSQTQNIQFQQVMKEDLYCNGDEQFYRTQGGSSSGEYSEASLNVPAPAGSRERVSRSAIKSDRDGRQERKDEGMERDASAALSAYAIYRTEYKAELDEDVVTVRGRILFDVFRPGVRIPLIRSNVGLVDVSVNRGASFVFADGGKYYLLAEKTGRYDLDIEFLIKAVRERENGPGNFSFEVLPAPISQFEFTMPETGVEIFVDPAIKLEVKKEGSGTVAWAVMPNTSTITTRWTKALPKETIASDKLEPKIYLDTATYASVGEGLVRCQAKLNYSILQSEVSTLRLALADDISVLDVRGANLRDWKVTNKDNKQYLDTYLNFLT